MLHHAMLLQANDWRRAATVALRLTSMVHAVPMCQYSFEMDTSTLSHVMLPAARNGQPLALPSVPYTVIAVGFRSTSRASLLERGLHS
jgi:hypothetical protein